MVKLLLVNNASVNERDNSTGSTALSRAIVKRKTKIVKLLLENGANVNLKDRDNWTPLHIASRIGQLDLVKLLIQYGADASAEANFPINSPNESPSQVTSVDLATHFKHREIVKVFFKNYAKRRNQSMKLGR